VTPVKIADTFVTPSKDRREGEEGIGGAPLSEPMIRQRPLSYDSSRKKHPHTVVFNEEITTRSKRANGNYVSTLEQLSTARKILQNLHVKVAPDSKVHLSSTSNTTNITTSMSSVSNVSSHVHLSKVADLQRENLTLKDEVETLRERSESVRKRVMCTVYTLVPYQLLPLYHTGRLSYES
jgi:hypothetical protein